MLLQGAFGLGKLPVLAAKTASFTAVCMFVFHPFQYYLEAVFLNMAT